MDNQEVGMVHKVKSPKNQSQFMQFKIPLNKVKAEVDGGPKH